MNVETMLSSIVVGVIGLAIVAVLVSQRANTANVIGASSSGLAGVISAAVAPVSGASSATPITFNSGAQFGAAAMQLGQMV